MFTATKNDAKVFICPGHGTAHWCASCCRQGTRCAIHRCSLVNATNLFRSVEFLVVPSSIGGCRPTSMDWKEHRKRSLASKLVSRTATHPLVRLNRFSSIGDALNSLTFTDTIVRTVSSVSPVTGIFCLCPWLVVDVRCDVDQVAISVLCFAPEEQSTSAFCVKLEVIGIEVKSAQIPLRVSMPVGSTVSMPLGTHPNVVGSLPPATEYVAHFWVSNGVDKGGTECV